MPKSDEAFRSTDGRRLVLVVDDEAVNRELLGAILGSDYDVIFAADGRQAMRSVHEHKDTLSLVLLDLMMPVMTGTEVLRQIKDDPEIAHIPVVVVTSDQSAEVESLGLGAIDFIPKPYPQPRVILARVLRTIELYEDRQIISSTERDALTGLYNREYFYRYAIQFDQRHKDVDMDAIVVDVNHFHMINERYGRARGDDVLRRIGEKICEVVDGVGGIACRREADMFLVYCPHREDYQEILENASIGLTGDGSSHSRVRLRMGVYSHVDKAIDMERRFDRAKNAADTVRNSFARTVAVYDNALHEQELYAEQLIEDFHGALETGQFEVYYQPKFDVRSDVPVLSSAEALVRWRHPRLGMISPGVFIPLFEDNGLIQELDTHVWRTTAEQIRDWRDRLGYAAPVSVNVSRIDMYDPGLVDKFQDILSCCGLAPSDILLEITESAYTQDSEQIVDMVGKLRRLGFRIEMDDFGTGYSSLNMISTLPIDALKLDMQFTRAAFGHHGDTRLLEVIIDIADYLHVPVIAEGVETVEQLNALKDMGCDIVQGYYFSRPVSADEFERFIVERRDLDKPDARTSARDEALYEASDPEPEEQGLSSVAYTRIARALSQDYFCIYYVDAQTEQYAEYSPNGTCGCLGIEGDGTDFFHTVRKGMLNLAHPEDLDKLMTALAKENMLLELQDHGTYTLTYRMMLGGKSTYVSLKATRMEDRNDSHIVIGISNVDAQMRRELERQHELGVARDLANRDALTGVKNKLAYMEAERVWNDRLAKGATEPFAVAVCDVNGLKRVNDTHGHKAGDAYIKEACALICNTFKHSPVYRIGGDEFVAILSGSDYESRDDLLRAMDKKNREQAVEGGLVVACGIAQATIGEDMTLGAVFERADAAMYMNKKSLKEGEDR